MLEASVLMYAYADLRELARNGKLEECSRQLLHELPISAKEVFDLVQANLQTLKQTMGSSVDMYLSCLSNSVQRPSPVSLFPPWNGPKKNSTTQLLLFKSFLLQF